MLFRPQAMVTDHFNAPCTPMTEFWIRGSSTSLLGLCYAISQMPVSQAVPICAATSFAVGVIYPWNAKFGYLTKGLPVKYPMHYVPEVLMAVLSALGAYFAFAQK